MHSQLWRVPNSVSLCVLCPQENQPAAVHAERGGEDAVEASVRVAFLPARRRHQTLPGGKSHETNPVSAGSSGLHTAQTMKGTLYDVSVTAA